MRCARSVPSHDAFDVHRAPGACSACLATVRVVGRGRVCLHGSGRGGGSVLDMARRAVDFASMGPSWNPICDCDSDGRDDLVRATAQGSDQASGDGRIGSCVCRVPVRPERHGRNGRVSGVRSAVRRCRRSSIVEAGRDLRLERSDVAVLICIGQRYCAAGVEPAERGRSPASGSAGVSLGASTNCFLDRGVCLRAQSS